MGWVARRKKIPAVAELTGHGKDILPVDFMGMKPARHKAPFLGSNVISIALCAQGLEGRPLWRPLGTGQRPSLQLPATPLRGETFASSAWLPSPP